MKFPRPVQNLIRFQRQYNHRFRMLNRYNANGRDFSRDKEELQNLRFLIRINRRRISFYTMCVIATLAVCAIVYYLIGKVSTTNINADLLLKEIYLHDISQPQTGNTPTFMFPAQSSVSLNIIEGTANPKNSAVYFNRDSSHSHPFAVTFEQPANCDLSVKYVDSNLLEVNLLPQKKTDFEYSIQGQNFARQVADQRLPVNDNIVMSPSVALEKQQEVNISLLQPKPFTFPNLFVRSLYFQEESKTDAYPRSLILGGKIRLLDTKEDVVTLYDEDYLEVVPTNLTKIAVSYERDGLHLRFNANVSKLTLKSAIQDAQPKTLMPLKIKTHYENYPYLWIIIPVLLPIFLNFFIRNK